MVTVPVLTGQHGFGGWVSQVQGGLPVCVADVWIGAVLEQHCAGET